MGTDFKVYLAKVAAGGNPSGSEQTGTASVQQNSNFKRYLADVASGKQPSWKQSRTSGAEQTGTASVQQNSDFKRYLADVASGKQPSLKQSRTTPYGRKTSAAANTSSPSPETTGQESALDKWLRGDAQYAALMPDALTSLAVQQNLEEKQRNRQTSTLPETTWQESALDKWLRGDTQYAALTPDAITSLAVAQPKEKNRTDAAAASEKAGSQGTSADEYAEWQKGYERWQEAKAQGLSVEAWASSAEDAYRQETDSLKKLQQKYNMLSRESVYGSQLWDGGVYLGQDAEAEARYAAQLQELQAQIEQAKQKRQEAKQDMTWANQFQYLESQIQMSQMTAADYAKELEKLEPVLEQAKALQAERNRAVYGPVQDPDLLLNAPAKLDSLLKEYGYEDVDALKQAVETYRSGAWFAERESRYNSLSEAPDFAELSAPASEKATAGFGLGIGTSWWGQGDPEYDYINNLDGARLKSFNATTMSTGPYGIYDEMEPEEIANYNYLYNKEGRDAARDYLDYLKYTLNARTLEKVQENAVTLAEENPKLASALSIPANLTGGVGLLDVAGQHIKRAVSGEYRPIDYNTRAMAPTVTGSTIRETRAAAIADATGIIQLDEEEHPILSRILNGKSLGDVYQLGMSMLDSLAIGLTPLGPFGAILLGGSAGTQGMLDALKRGASDEQALAMGILNGTFEALFEYVSLDKLLKGDTRNVVKAFFQQGFVEGIGEANTTFFNNIADILVMAEKSDYRQAVEDYRAAGLSQEEAEKQALLDKAIEIGWDFIGGSIMGGVSGGGYTAVSDLSQNWTARRIYGSSVSELVNETLEIDPDNRFAQELRQKLDKGGKASGNQIYNLVQQNEAALRAQDVSRIQTAAANRLRALGESGDVEAVSAALAKKAAGEKLTRAEERAISGSRYGVRVANELDAGNIRSGLTSSDWAGKIGTARIHAEEYGRLLDKADGLRENSPAEAGAKAGKLTGENKNVTVKTKDGQEGLLTGIDEEGRAIVKTGETETRLDIEEADMPEGARALLRAVKPLGENADAAFKAYDGSLTVQEYAKQWDFAQNLLAANGASREAIDRSPLTQGLNPRQKAIAYDYGRRAYEAEKEKAVSAEKGSKAGQSRKGRVSYDGGVVEGIRYRGVNPEQLNRKQKTQIAVVQAVAEAAGLDVTLFDGEAKGVQGIYLQNGEIYLNVNAGAAINRSTLLFVMAHELTHFIQQNAKAEYARLKNFAVKNLLEAGDGKLEELVLKKQNARGGLSYSEALDEVIADGCESMLKNSEAIRQLAKENRNLAEKIQDWISDFVQKLKKAFAGLEARHEEARILMEHAEELQALWDAGLIEAVHNRNDETVYAKDGTVKYALRDVPIPSYAELIKKPPVQVIDIRENLSGGYKEQRKAFLASEEAKQICKTPVVNKDTGEQIFFTERSMTHSYSNDAPYKTNLLKHVREVAENAVLTKGEISRHAPDDRTTGVYRFFGAVRTDSGIQPVKLTVKEYILEGQNIPANIKVYLGQNEGGNTYASVYDGKVLVVEDIEEGASSSAPSTNGIIPIAEKYPSAPSVIKIADLLELVKGENRKDLPAKTEVRTEASSQRSEWDGEADNPTPVQQDSQLPNRLEHGRMKTKGQNIPQWWELTEQQQEAITRTIESRVAQLAGKDRAELLDRHTDYELPEQIYSDYTHGQESLDYWSQWFGDANRLAADLDSGLTTPASNLQNLALQGSSQKGKGKNKDPYRRPKGYRKGMREKVWENSKNENGEVIDPVTQRVIDPNEPWDMGHKPGYEFWKLQQSARERGITRKQFLDEYYNLDYFRAELPSSNRGHKGEAPPNVYFGP